MYCKWEHVMISFKPKRKFLTAVFSEEDKKVFVLLKEFQTQLLATKVTN